MMKFRQNLQRTCKTWLIGGSNSFGKSTKTTRSDSNASLWTRKSRSIPLSRHLIRQRGRKRRSNNTATCSAPSLGFVLRGMCYRAACRRHTKFFFTLFRESLLPQRYKTTVFGGTEYDRAANCGSRWAIGSRDREFRKVGRNTYGLAAVVESIPSTASDATRTRG